MRCARRSHRDVGGYCTPRSPAETAPAVGPLVEPRAALRLVSSTGLRLSRRDRDDLVAFLHSLCDHALLSDPRFADPFAR